MATEVPVKSILKTPKPKQAETTSQDQEKADRDRHNYNFALAHAYRIQDQKDWEARILKAIEVLLDYPSSPVFTSQEALNFPKLILPFQPSDLDALVEERVVDGKCGYALCAKQPRSATLGKDAEWRAGAGGMNFCSVKCAKKSAYVRVQLSEVPAWEREPGLHPQILLHEDDRSASLNQPAAPARRQQAAASKRGDDDELAMERGEQATSFRPKQVMTDRIVEKGTTTYKPLSSISGAAISHTAIEGYEPTERRMRAASGRSDGEESEESEVDENVTAVDEIYDD